MYCGNPSNYIKMRPLYFPIHLHVYCTRIYTPQAPTQAPTHLHSLTPTLSPPLPPPQPEEESVTTPTPHSPSHPPPTACDKPNWPEEWSRLSVLVTGERVCIWERFLRQLFFERAKVKCSCMLTYKKPQPQPLPPNP